MSSKHPDNNYLPTHDASKFAWHKRHGTANASDLCGILKSVDAYVWHDSVDRGFWLYNPRTGGTKLFTLVDKIYAYGNGAASELESSNYVCDDDPTITVAILND